MMKLTITDLGKQYRRDLWGLKNFSVEIPACRQVGV